MRTESINSAALGETREFRISTHPMKEGEKSTAPVVLVVLEADRFLDGLGATAVLDHAAKVSRTPVTALWLPQEKRDRLVEECSCRLEFAQFLAIELPTRAAALGVLPPEAGRPILLGIGFSGLAALHSAWRHPGCFSAVGAISPALWFRREWLTAHLARAERVVPRFLVAAGLDEDTVPAIPTISALPQQSSVLAAARRLHAALKKRGDCKSDCWEFEGGPDDASLRSILLPIILHLLLAGGPPAPAIR